MKKTALGFAAVLALGLASFAAPASAMPAAPGLATHGASDVTTVQYRHRHHHRYHRMHRRPVCTYRTVMSRHHGRRVVRKIRVCR